MNIKFTIISNYIFSVEKWEMNKKTFTCIFIEVLYNYIENFMLRNSYKINNN